MSAATEVVGIVAEYNPLHQGHVAQIKAVRKAFGDAPIVIALTGAFVQRGEPAVADPWTRARWALHAGADLVVELPAIFALRSAEHFAAGGVRLLHAVGVATLVCGAENPDLAALKKLADGPNPTALQTALAQGLSYPAAMEAAFAATDPDIAPLLRTPNNILAAGYLRAIERYAPSLCLAPLLRERSDSAEGIAGISGSAVRARLQEGLVPRDMLPAYTYDDLSEALRAGVFPQPERYELLALQALRLLTPATLAQLGEFSEGLEDRWYAARNAATLAEFWNDVKTKRYPQTRLSRLLVQVLLGMRRQDLNDAAKTGPAWLYPLAFTPRGAALLRNVTLPILDRYGKMRKTLPPQVVNRLVYDERATDLAALCRANPEYRAGGARFYRRPVTPAKELQ
ncbi:MAG: nucleotidyltransferase family protein [Negativicoccus succinicivorans]|nr:nucleotidyltransferase family protein [Negativicoccus succinicivorans]